MSSHVQLDGWWTGVSTLIDHVSELTTRQLLSAFMHDTSPAQLAQSYNYAVDKTVLGPGNDDVVAAHRDVSRSWRPVLEVSSLVNILRLMAKGSENVPGTVLSFDA